MELICNQEVNDLLAKQAVIEVVDNSPRFYSSLFAIANSSGGFRPIVNLKLLNSFIF